MYLAGWHALPFAAHAPEAPAFAAAGYLLSYFLAEKIHTQDNEELQNNDKKNIKESLFTLRSQRVSHAPRSSLSSRTMIKRI